MQAGPVLGAILHPSAFDYRMCLFDCLFGKQRLSYWLTAWRAPTHLSCTNVILLLDIVCQMITVNVTTAFLVVCIYKVWHFTLNILEIAVFMLKSMLHVNIYCQYRCAANISWEKGSILYEWKKTGLPIADISTQYELRHVDASNRDRTRITY